VREENNTSIILRQKMVETQIKRRGINEKIVLDSMLKVPRHLFMPGYSLENAYDDHAMPIGHGQTISQPYMVAVMTELLFRNSTNHLKALEIGTGSGYQAAILSLIFEKVISIERIQELAHEARNRLNNLGYTNVEVVIADGTLGWEKSAPYDGIIVTAGAPKVPQPLIDQISEGGCLVVPVGSRFIQEVKVVKKRNGKIEIESADGCVFVPLIGKEGWDE